MFLSEPIVLYGGGQYAMTGVKYISVSQEFLDLDINTRNCQTEESLEDCKNRKYHGEIIAQCGCLPFSFKHLVDITVWRDFIFIQQKEQINISIRWQLALPYSWTV